MSLLNENSLQGDLNSIIARVSKRMISSRPNSIEHDLWTPSPHRTHHHIFLDNNRSGVLEFMRTHKQQAAEGVYSQEIFSNSGATINFHSVLSVLLHRRQVGKHKLAADFHLQWPCGVVHNVHNRSTHRELFLLSNDVAAVPITLRIVSHL